MGLAVNFRDESDVGRWPNQGPARRHMKENDAYNIASEIGQPPLVSDTEFFAFVVGRERDLGVLPDDLALEHIRELDAKIAGCHERLDRLSTPEADIQDALRFGERFFLCIDEFWNGASNAARKQLQRFVFPDGITVSQSGEFRTPKTHAITGLQALAHAGKCQVVDLRRLELLTSAMRMLRSTR